MRSLFLFFLLLLSRCVIAALPIPLDLNTVPQQNASHAWPVAAPLSAPDGLRPCCAFGYNLRAQVTGIPVPFYRLNNLVEAEHLGKHVYNDSMLSALANLTGLSSEKDGIVYTRRGGFIDVAHVRDTADMTLYLFTRILPVLGKTYHLTLGEELARREIVLFPFHAPVDPIQRYTLAAWLAAKLAFQVAAWHEVAQWYGFESVPGFSEQVSAFSPEDLYSNLLGARLATSLILMGHAASRESFNVAMHKGLQEALGYLDAQPFSQTRFQFDMLDGKWWDSHQRVPAKFLVLKRNYDTQDNRIPTPVPGEDAVIQRLMLPEIWHDYSLQKLGEIRFWPGKSMKNLPVPTTFYRFADLKELAESARLADAKERPAY